jgi:hypothetical protein
MMADEPVVYHAHILTMLKTSPTDNDTNAGPRLADELGPVLDDFSGMRQNTALVKIIRDVLRF